MRCKLIILFLILLIPSSLWATVTLPYSQTFNCDEIEITLPGTYCTNIYYNSGGSVDGHYSQITSGANYPGGGGEKGARFWVGKGHNVNTGKLSIEFVSAQTELYIRWYMRHQSGFDWQDDSPCSEGCDPTCFLHFDKTLYIRGNASYFDTLLVFHNGYSLMAIYAGSAGGYYNSTNFGWQDVYGGIVSDGSWHWYELHLKMDTTSTPYDGIAQLWVDGILRINSSTANFSNDNTTARLGWLWFDFENNQSCVLTTLTSAYVDYDDIAIQTTGPIGPFTTGKSSITIDGGSQSITIGGGSHTLSW